MTVRAVRVPKARGEQTRSHLRELGVLRADIEVGHDGDHLLFPIQDGGSVPGEWGETVDVDLPNSSARGPQDYRDLLNWPPAERDSAPRAFDVVGDIVLVRLPPELEPRGPAIGDALLRFVPGARLVGQDRGVHGTARRRQVERLAGTGGWTTRHKENGVVLEVDLEGAYFSPRLAREHARVAGEVRTGDRVYDLCCGVGPFAVTIARDERAARVVAVDSNPIAIDCLRSTLARVPYGHKVEAVDDRIEHFLIERPPVERVVFNLPHEGIKYLSSVANLVSRAGRLFYYEVAERDARELRTQDVLAAVGGAPSWSLRESHVVHPYSPTSDLVAYSLERNGG